MRYIGATDRPWAASNDLPSPKNDAEESNKQEQKKERQVEQEEHKEYQRRRQQLRKTVSQHRSPWTWLSLSIFVPFMLLTLSMRPSMLTFDSDSSRWLAEASQSGIYVDNGVDQTVMHRALDEDEKLEASDNILEFLGLPDRPPRHALHGEHLSLRYATKYMNCRHLLLQY